MTRLPCSLLLLLLTSVACGADPHAGSSVGGGAVSGDTVGSDAAGRAPTDVATADGASTDGAAAGDASGTDSARAATGPRRVLLLIADDLGVDQLAAYAGTDSAPAAGHVYPSAPTLSAICDQGMRFDFAWSAPTCSPTRATILTGRYGFRTGVGWAVAKKNQLALAETTLPELLSAAGVATANIGKWHLGDGDDIGGSKAPNAAGWQHFAGSISGVLDEYSEWQRTVDGAGAWSKTYATTANVDDALAWAKARDPGKPWLLWVAFNAPHSPFHKPPAALHDAAKLPGTSAHIKNNPAPYYRAMVQALDTEVARLLAQLEASGQAPTDVVFIGDNGSPGQVVVAPWDADKAKGTLYEGGVRVPFCVRGRAVAKPGSSGALVHTVDLFATIAGWFGAPPTSPVGQDSQDLAPLLADPKATWRGFNYTESFGNPQGTDDQEGRAITDGRFKLIRFASGAELLFDLDADRHEAAPLDPTKLTAEAKAAYDGLATKLGELK